MNTYDDDYDDIDSLGVYMMIYTCIRIILLYCVIIIYYILCVDIMIHILRL